MTKIYKKKKDTLRKDRLYGSKHEWEKGFVGEIKIYKYLELRQTINVKSILIKATKIKPFENLLPLGLGTAVLQDII